MALFRVKDHPGFCWNCGYDVRGARDETASCSECGEAVHAESVRLRRERYLERSRPEAIVSLLIAISAATTSVIHVSTGMTWRFGFLTWDPISLGMIVPLAAATACIPLVLFYARSLRPVALTSYLRAMWLMVVIVTAGYLITVFTSGPMVLVFGPVSLVVGWGLFLARWRVLARRAAIPNRDNLAGFPAGLILMQTAAMVLYPVCVILWYVVTWDDQGW